MRWAVDCAGRVFALSSADSDAPRGAGYVATESGRSSAAAVGPSRRHEDGDGGTRNPGVMGDNGAVSSPREIVLLGSTGSIGTQAIEIVRANPDRFRVVALGAGGGNVELLATQALELGVEIVGVARASVAQDLQLAFYAVAQQRGWATGDFRLPKIVAGPDAMTELASFPCDTVLNAVVGSRGLAPTLAALRAGRTLALANKESLVAGGPLVRAVAKPGQIVPVDSEHSALAQCLRSGAPARGTATCADRERRTVPGPKPRRTRRRDTRAGAASPDVEHGPGCHDQLGDHGQQGTRGDRGA